jgi:hypothetical protein
MIIITDLNEGAEPDELAVFKFSAFTGECSDSGSVINYYLSTSKSSISASDDFPLGIESMGTYYQTELYTEVTNTYEGYIFAEQHDTQIVVEFLFTVEFQTIEVEVEIVEVVEAEVVEAEVVESSSDSTDDATAESTESSTVSSGSTATEDESVEEQVQRAATEGFYFNPWEAYGVG